MFVTAVVFFALFVLSGIVNVAAAFFEKEKIRRFSKPFCLFFLSLSAIFFAPAAPLIYIGTICGLVGDAILLNKDKKVMVGVGTFAFLIGHLCYIVEAFRLIYASGVLGKHPNAYIWMIVYGILVLAMSFYPIYRLSGRSRVFTPIGMLYSSVLVTDGAVAILGCALGLSQWLFLLIIGDAFFIVSDLILAYTIFIGDIKRRDFYIMSTYLVGQAFIVAGLVFTFLK